MRLQPLFAIPRSLLKVSFVRDILTLQAGSVFSTGLAFVKSVAYARLLGLENFGLYAVVLAFTGTFAVATNFGQNQAAMIFFSEAYSKKNEKEMRRVLRYYFELASLAVITLAVLALIAPVVANSFYDNPVIGSLARLSFLATLAGSFDTLFVILLQTVRRIKLMTALENLNSLLQLLLGIGFILLGMGVAGIFVGLAISNVIMLAIYVATYFSIRGKHGLPHIRSALTKTESTMPLIKQGFWIAIDKNIGNLFPKSFLFVLSFFAAPSIVGIAQLAEKIGSLPSSLFLPHVGRMAMTVLPAIAAKGTQELRRHCALLIKHALFFHAAVSFASLFALPFMVILLYGKEYEPVIWPALWIVLIQIISAVNVLNSPLFRLYRKAYVPAVWGMTVMPLELLLLIGLLHVLPPLSAFLWSIFSVYALCISLSVYLYQMIVIRKEEIRPIS